MEDATSKHSLFEKVYDFESLMLEYRSRGFQIWGHRQPSIYRSRDPAKLWTKSCLKKALTWRTSRVNIPYSLSYVFGKWMFDKHIDPTDPNMWMVSTPEMMNKMSVNTEQ